MKIHGPFKNVKNVIIFVIICIVSFSIGYLMCQGYEPETTHDHVIDQVDVVEREKAWKFYEHPQTFIYWHNVDLTGQIWIELILRGDRYWTFVNGKLLISTPTQWDEWDYFNLSTFMGGNSNEYIADSLRYLH